MEQIRTTGKHIKIKNLFICQQPRRLEVCDFEMIILKAYIVFMIIKNIMYLQHLEALSANLLLHIKK